MWHKDIAPYCGWPILKERGMVDFYATIVKNRAHSGHRNMKITEMKPSRRYALGAVLGILSFLIIFVLSGGYFDIIADATLDLVRTMRRHGYSEPFMGIMIYVCNNAQWIPAVLLAMYIYHHFARINSLDGHTRCGQCGYILKGLTEPQCTECGTKI